MPEPLIQQNQIVPNPSPNCTLATVGTAASQVLAANIQRRGLMFANPSANATIWVAPVGVALTANTGIPILPGAEPLMIAHENFQNNVAWQAIASANGTPLTVLEFV